MKFSNVISIATIAVTMLFGNQASASTQISINGSTTVLPIMQKVAENYMLVNPDIQISISGGGSGNGIKALIDGLCDIAMSSRDIKNNEAQLAKKNNVDPTRIAVGIDALIPIVHSSNSVKNVTMKQLQEIYMGKINNWKEIGGKDAPIVVISRDTSSGTYETWYKRVMQKQRIMPAALLQASNGSAVQTVSTNPNAIAYIGFGYLNDTIKALSIDGVIASQESALNGSWGIARELYVFINGKGTPEIQAFMTYLLDPQKGQKAVEEIGFIKLQQK